MSQAKVDQYKKEKANRKRVIARNKVISRIVKAVVALACCGIICLIAVSGYNYYQANRDLNTYYVDLSAISDYSSSLSE